MIALPRNPLLPHPVQPDPSQSKRKFSIRPRKTAASRPDLTSTGLYNVVNAGTSKHEQTVLSYVSGTRQDGRSVQKFGGPRPDSNYHGGPSGISEGRSRGADYGLLLQKGLEVARMTQANWREDANIHIRQQQEAQQEILRIAREERNRIAEEQRQIDQRLLQQYLEAHQTRLEDIARQRRFEEESRRIEAEERRRIAREWHERAEQQLRDEELQLAARVAEEQQRREAEEEAQALQDVIEEAERQERIDEAERQRVARLRDCTVCMDAFDMEGMVELECEHWYCRADFQGTDVVFEPSFCHTDAAQLLWKLLMLPERYFNVAGARVESILAPVFFLTTSSPAIVYWRKSCRQIILYTVPIAAVDDSYLQHKLEAPMRWHVMNAVGSLAGIVEAKRMPGGSAPTILKRSG